MQAVKKRTVIDQFNVHLLPSAYAIETDGSCMDPIIKSGEKIEVHRGDAIRAGDVVVLYFRSHIQLPNGWAALVKRIRKLPPKWLQFPYDHDHEDGEPPFIMVEQVNPYRLYRCPCTDILALHRCAGTVAAERCYPASIPELEVA